MRQLLAVLALLTGSASAQAWEPISHSPDGLFVGFMPRALAVGADGDVFLPATCIQCAGPFDGIAHWDAQTAAWSPIPIVPGMAVSVPQLVEADGSLYAAIGVNTPLEVDGQQLIGLARYDLATETWDGLEGGLTAPSFGFQTIVYDLEVGPDGRIYAGGEFENAGGPPANFVAAWDPATRTWDDLGGGPGARVFEIAVDADGKVYASGVFSIASATVLVAVYDPDTGAWTGLPVDVFGAIEGLEVDRASGTLYAAGALRAAGGARFPLASYDGSAWTPLGTPGPITTEAEALRWSADGGLYIAGYLGPLEGIPTSAIERLDLASGTWTEVAGGVAGRVAEMEGTPDGEVAVAGNFATASSAAIGDRDVAAPAVVVSDAAAGWRSLGSSVAGSGPQEDAPTVVRGLDATADGQSVYAVGLFETAADQVVKNVARWDAATGSWHPLGDGVLGGGNDVAVGNDGAVYLSNAGIVRGVRRWDPAAETWTDVVGFEGYVRGFERMPDRQILLSNVTSAGGTAAGAQLGLALFDPAAATFDVLEGGPPDTPGFLLGSASAGAPDGRIYVGRTYSDGGVRADVARFDPGPRTWTTLAAPGTQPTALAVGPGGELWLAGGGGGLAAGGVLRYDATAEAWAPVGTNTPAVAEALSFAPDGSVLVSGTGGILRLAAGADTFEPVGELAGQGGTTVPASFAYEAGGALILGGRFRSVGGVYSPRVARWTGTAGGGTATGGGPDGGLALAVWPNPSAGRVRLTTTLASAGPIRTTLHDLLGRTVAVLAEGSRAAGPLRLDADLGGLAPGVYLVRLAAEGRVETRRVTVLR